MMQGRPGTTTRNMSDMRPSTEGCAFGIYHNIYTSTDTTYMRVDECTATAQHVESQKPRTTHREAAPLHGRQVLAMS